MFRTSNAKFALFLVVLFTEFVVLYYAVLLVLVVVYGTPKLFWFPLCWYITFDSVDEVVLEREMLQLLMYEMK